MCAIAVRRSRLREAFASSRFALIVLAAGLGGCDEESTIIVNVVGAGDGFGQVTGSNTTTGLAEIHCTVDAGQTSLSDCQESIYKLGGSYTLVAQPVGGSSFTGWFCSSTGGDCTGCTGTGNCVLTFTEAGTTDIRFTVTARFDALPGGACPLSQPLARWTMDGNTADVVGTADGPANLPSGISGAIDRKLLSVGALQFDGTAGFNVGTATTFDNLTLPFTIAVWLYREAGPTSASIFATDPILSSYQGIWMGWGANTLGISFGDGGGGGPSHRRSAAGAQVPVGQWTHIAAVVTGPDSLGFKLYVNGTAIAHTYEGTGGPLVHSASAGPNIGSWQLVAANQPWKGRMDDLRLYNCALSAVDVTTLQALIASPSQAPVGRFNSHGSGRSGVLVLP